MPYTGLNSYAPLSDYKGTVINTDILDSYEKHIKPYDCIFIRSGSSTANFLATTDASFELKQGVRIRVDFDQIDAVNFQTLRARTLNVNSTGAYPIVTNGKWEQDKFPVNSSTIMDLIFTGTSWEMEENILSFRSTAATSMYNAVHMKSESWYNNDILGSMQALKTIPQTGYTYSFGQNSVSSSGTVQRMHCYKLYGKPILIPGFNAFDFYGCCCGVAYIQGATYVVRSEWDEAADDNTASSVTSLWKSTDGINFTRHATISAGAGWECGDLKYNGTYWIFYPHSSSNYFYYSTNGTTWTKRTGPAVDWFRLSVANGRFYLTNIEATTSTAYYCTNPTSWSSCSLPATGLWTNIVYFYDYSAKVYYYFAYGGSADSNTSNSYFAYSTSGTGSWTNNIIGAYGPVISIYGLPQYDDSTLITAELETVSILMGPGYPGSAYILGGNVRMNKYNYFDAIVSEALSSSFQSYGHNLFSYASIGGQIVCNICGRGPNSTHTTSRVPYVYKQEYTISGEFSISGADQGLDVSKVYCGQYTGTGLYGSSNKTTISLPFKAKFGIIKEVNNNWYTLIAVHPNPVVSSYDTTGVTQRMQYGYNSFHSLQMKWTASSVSWYSSSSASYQLNTSGTKYDYIFWG